MAGVWVAQTARPSRGRIFGENVTREDCARIYIKSECRTYSVRTCAWDNEGNFGVEELTTTSADVRMNQA